MPHSIYTAYLRTELEATGDNTKRIFDEAMKEAKVGGALLLSDTDAHAVRELYRKKIDALSSAGEGSVE